MPQQEFSDANFFALVHHVIEAARQDEDSDRRDNKRHKFSCQQLIAPYRDGRMPAQGEFRKTLCHDLSPRGFSFYASEPCRDEYLIVALGAAPFIFVSAAVVHQRPIEIDGREQLLVGCRFIARITQGGPAAMLMSNRS